MHITTCKTDPCLLLICENQQKEVCSLLREINNSLSFREVKLLNPTERCNSPPHSQSISLDAEGLSSSISSLPFLDIIIETTKPQQYVTNVRLLDASQSGGHGIMTALLIV